MSFTVPLSETKVTTIYEWECEMFPPEPYEDYDWGEDSDELKQDYGYYSYWEDSHDVRQRWMDDMYEEYPDFDGGGFGGRYLCYPPTPGVEFTVESFIGHYGESFLESHLRIWFDEPRLTLKDGLVTIPDDMAPYQLERLYEE